MKILLIEDDPDIKESTAAFLLEARHIVETADNFREGEDKIHIFEYDLVILDIGLPGGSGLDILRALKKINPDTAVLILSAKDSLDDRLTGLDLGADDYVTKPFHLSELNARINAIYRRRVKGGAKYLSFNEFKLDTDSNVVYINDEQVELSKKEYDLLLYFITNAKRVLSKSAIAEHIWGDYMIKYLLMKFQIKSSIVYILLFGLISFQASSQKLYKTTWGKSGTIFGSSVAMFGGAKFIENQRGPITIDDLASLNSDSFLEIDEGAVKQYSIQAGINSDHFRNGALIAPLTLFLSRQARSNAREIAVMYAEVFSLNGGITLLTKDAVSRFRPYSYNPDVPLDVKFSPTTRRSFFSGHVSHVASLSFFTATVFDDLYPDSPFRYAVWAGAIAAPAITGYLRYKAGRHFPTDIMVGYGVGALVGYFIPELHKLTKESNIDVIGTRGGLGLVYTF